MRMLMAAGGVSLLLATTGCGAFFQCEGKADCGTSGSGTGSGTGDYVYVSNSVSGSQYLDGFEISGGSLVSITGFPASLGYTPSAMAITPTNTFLYIASQSSTGGIYGYSIGASGAITALNNGNGLESENSIALAISPDGRWLFSLNLNNETFEEYQINTSTGILTSATTVPYAITNNATGGQKVNGSLDTGAPLIAVAPSGDFVAIALGNAGVETFSFVTSSGVATFAQQSVPNATTVGFYGVAADSNNNLYVAGTNALYSFAVNSSGVFPATATSFITTGTGPYSVAVDGSSYVYAGSENSNYASIISGASITSGGVLGTPSNSAAPANIGALGIDRTGDYLVAAGYNATTGIQLFSIGSTGAITSVSSTGSGPTTTVPVVMALTH